MKYALLIYQPHPFDPKALPPEEHARIGADYAGVSATPNVSPGLPLGKLQDAVTVRMHNGQAIVTSGPYVDAAGAIGGFVVFEADNQQEAIELATRIPAVRLGGGVEIRPCEVYW